MRLGGFRPLYILELDVLDWFLTWYIKHAIIPVFTYFYWGFIVFVDVYRFELKLITLCKFINTPPK